MNRYGRWRLAPARSKLKSRSLASLFPYSAPAVQHHCATMLKQRLMMRDMAVSSKQRLLSRLLAARARRKTKRDSGQQQHSSCKRCILSWHHCSIDTRSSERCDIVKPSCAGGCR